MEEYLCEGGFIQHQMNNHKNNYYLFNKHDDNNFIVYLKKNAIRCFLKKHFTCSINTCPDEMFIIKHDHGIVIKIIDTITKPSKLKQIPFMKKNYEMELKAIQNVIDIKYAVKLPKDVRESVIDILFAYDIPMFFHDEECQNKLDAWLDE